MLTDLNSNPNSLVPSPQPPLRMRTVWWSWLPAVGARACSTPARWLSSTSSDTSARPLLLRPPHLLPPHPPTKPPLSQVRGSSVRYCSFHLSPEPSARLLFVPLACLLQVVEKGVFLQTVVDMLRDGSPKLQLAYLNILNLLFCDECYCAAAAGESSLSAMSAARNTLAKAKGLVQSLVRLAEHGASGSIRAKTLLSLQLLLRHHPALLAGLGEKRLPSVLARLVDPLSADAAALQGRAAVSRHALPLVCRRVELNRPLPSQASLLLFVRADLVEACAALNMHLASLAAGLPQTHSGALTSPATSPSKSGRAWHDAMEPEAVSLVLLYNPLYRVLISLCSSRPLTTPSERPIPSSSTNIALQTTAVSASRLPRGRLFQKLPVAGPPGRVHAALLDPTRT